MKLKDFAASHKAAVKQSTPVSEIDATPEIEVRLFRSATATSNNQYRGRIDEAGTVRVRVYIGGQAAEHRGEILVGTLNDVTLAEPVEMSDGTKLTKLTFTDTLADHSKVILWAPEDADIEGVKILL